jgi:hypothetical protein
MRFRFPSGSFARLLVVCAASLVAPILCAQTEGVSTNYSLTLSAERPDALYKQGEPVRFNVRLLLDNQRLRGLQRADRPEGYLQ